MLHQKRAATTQSSQLMYTCTHTLAGTISAVSLLECLNDIEGYALIKGPWNVTFELIKDFIFGRRMHF